MSRARSYEIDELMEKIKDKYEFVKDIAEGSFGRVFAATAKDDFNQRRAIKLIKEGSLCFCAEIHAREHLFFREVELLKELNHEHIARFYDILDYSDSLYIVTEICDGGDLFAKILEEKRFSEKDAAQLGGQMLQAVRYMHSRHIVHRGIKAENFMLAAPYASSQLKLVDFSFARKFTPGTFMTDLCGAPHYLAPEMIGQKYNCLVDIWAFGVLQFLLMHGHYPYNGKTPTDIFKKILYATGLWQARARVSLMCMEFLQGVLAAHAFSRASAQEALEHVWLHQTDADAPREENPGEKMAKTQVEYTQVEYTIPSEAFENVQIGPLITKPQTKRARLEVNCEHDSR